MARQLSSSNPSSHAETSEGAFAVFEPEARLDPGTIEDWLRAEARLLADRKDDTGSDLSGPVEWIDDEMPRTWRKDI